MHNRRYGIIFNAALGSVYIDSQPIIIIIIIIVPGEALINSYTQWLGAGDTLYGSIFYFDTYVVVYIRQLFCENWLS